MKRHDSHLFRPVVIVALLTISVAAMSSGKAVAIAPPASVAAVVPDSTVSPGIGGSGISLTGGVDGSVLRNLTIEGEDRINLDFDRPALDLDLAARRAPGLGWKESWESVDIASSMIFLSALERDRYTGRPWSHLFATGKVASFRPGIGKVEKWNLTIADSRGRVIKTYSGKGRPPEEICWDGSTEEGIEAVPGLTYSFVVETWDRAGNPRSYIGDSFRLPPFYLVNDKRNVLVISGSEIRNTAANSARTAGGVPELLLEAASWLNQIERPGHRVIIETKARTIAEARDLADHLSAVLGDLVAGDPARISSDSRVLEDAPDEGIVSIIVKY
ncbi:MAG: hypothetical protein JW814_05575 [Candidatus Krumholzibacteriota bacterium]|nr:hypothetical protein [Candidatus Krumholzibacteriota bacterium]